MKRLWTMFVFVCLMSYPSASFAVSRFALENPQQGQVKSGVSVISGWICSASQLRVKIDSGPFQFVPYGSDRADTRSVCGDTNNGFGVLINFNNLGDGDHRLSLYDGNTLLRTVTFEVVTPGTAFLRGVVGHGSMDLSNGARIIFEWDQGTQGLAIVDVEQYAANNLYRLGELLGTWNVHVRYDNSSTGFIRQYKTWRITQSATDLEGFDAFATDSIDYSWGVFSSARIDGYEYVFTDLDITADGSVVCVVAFLGVNQGALAGVFGVHRFSGSYVGRPLMVADLDQCSSQPLVTGSLLGTKQ